jgi:hypothetical protein
MWRQMSEKVITNNEQLCIWKQVIVDQFESTYMRTGIRLEDLMKTMKNLDRDSPFSKRIPGECS